jgi:transcription elongation GreA/GreB family factor
MEYTLLEAMRVKSELRESVIAQLRAKLEASKKAMDTAQADANRYKGAMESRYDTFKEEAQALRNGFALQIQRTAEVLAQMEQIVVKKSDVVVLGAVVITTCGSMFVSTGLVDRAQDAKGESYDCVGSNAPLAQRLHGKRVGDSAEVDGKQVKIVKVF